jgi:hypothetical protein
MGRSLLFLGLIALISFDLYQTLKTGRARGKGGTITRKRRPDAFRRYVIGDCVVLAFALSALVAHGLGLI